MNPMAKPCKGEHRRSLLTTCASALGALSLTFCAASGALPPGVSDMPRPVSSPSASLQPLAVSRWEHFSELAILRQLTPLSNSRGHGTADLNGELRANELAAAEIDALRPGKHMPKGALLVMLHTQRRTGQAEDAFVMEKREPGYFPSGGDWDYAVVDSRGRVQNRGKLQPCARCHAEAAVDFVFPRVEVKPSANEG
jgi:hypothetical protein